MAHWEYCLEGLLQAKWWLVRVPTSRVCLKNSSRRCEEAEKIASWERRHPCRQISEDSRQLAGRDAGAARMHGSSTPHLGGFAAQSTLRRTLEYRAAWLFLSAWLLWPEAGLRGAESA